MYIKKIVDKELLVTIAVMLICMVLFLFFPADNIYQRIISGIVFFVVVPMLYVKFILKKTIIDFFKINFSKGDKSETIITVLSFILIILIFLAINKYTKFSDSYFLKDSELVKKYWGFMIYEFLIANIFIITYEFFFRGLVMSYFIDKIGKYAVFMQFLFFLILLLTINRLSIGFIYYIIIAPVAGMIAYRNKSIIYSYIFSFLAIFIGDIIFLTIN